jgi:hypothetical protein
MGKTFTFKTPKIKARGHQPPPTRVHKSKRGKLDAYDRRNFKSSRSWED